MNHPADGTSMSSRPRGRLHVGTSGFAYPDWAPRFYPAGRRSDRLLPAYAARLAACEINNTFYRWPTAEQLERWADQTPPDFRFVLKAQRASCARAMGSDPAEPVGRLLAPLAGLGPRLGTVLFRVPDTMERDEERLERLLAVWPPDVPLALEARHPSWERDEVFALLRAAGVAWVSTDADDADPPTLRTTGSFLYLRLRRSRYAAVELETWAARIEPFLADGLDVFTFFRHDADGASALAAERLRELAEAT